jgi:hypothetical protein
MYLADLSPSCETSKSLSVGWLESGHPYTTGGASEEFLDRLFDHCASARIRTRGFHVCSFCPPQAKRQPYSRNEKNAWLGSAQFRIRGRGKTYEAPNLIYHYVADHNYRPPEEFIEAIMRSRNWLQRQVDRHVFNCQ